MQQSFEKNNFIFSKYNYGSVVYGTFYKSEKLLHPQDESWDEFCEQFKKTHDLEHVIFAQQVHGDQVVMIDDHNFNQTFIADGFLTSKKKVALLAFHADCQVVHFFDRHQKVIGIVHAGFRGQIANIYSKAIHKMTAELNCKVEDLKAHFTPSLCQNHSEFKNFKEEFPEFLWHYKDARNHFDLKKMATDELLQNGVLEHNIFKNSDCTFEDESRFYSYRKTKTTRRHLSFIFFNG